MLAFFANDHTCIILWQQFAPLSGRATHEASGMQSQSRVRLEAFQRVQTQGFAVQGECERMVDGAAKSLSNLCFELNRVWVVTIHVQRESLLSDQLVNKEWNLIHRGHLGGFVFKQIRVGPRRHLGFFLLQVSTN